jgi:acid phosphatase (class A)
MNRKPFWSCLAVSLLLCIAAEKSHPPLKYLAKDDVDFLALLPEPPTKDSAEQKAEIQQILSIQSTRTPADEARAKKEEKFEVFQFAPIIGPDFTAEKCPLTAALFKDLETDSKYFSRTAKEHWERKRPPFIDANVHPSATLEDEGSYPSGHATRGVLYALLMADIFSEHRAELLEQGRQVGWDRVVGGVHYPSDVAAGRVLGQALAAKLMSKPEFRSQFELVKNELKPLVMHPTASAH